MPRCRYCSTTYKPARPMQPGRVCNSVECQHQHSMVFLSAQGKKKAQAERIAQIADRRTVRAKLDELRPLSYFANKAQSAVNEYVRVRDYEQGCISCDKDRYWDGQWHAGHLVPRGRNSFLRFHLWNINKQCSVCNYHNGGMVAAHERGVVSRYSQYRLDYLRAAPSSKRYDVDYLVRLASVMRAKTRVLKKRKGLQ